MGLKSNIAIATLSDEELLSLVGEGMHHYHSEVCRDSDSPCEHDIAFDELTKRLASLKKTSPVGLLLAARLRINELEETVQQMIEAGRRVVQSRDQCEICGYADGTVAYRGWHEDGNPMMTCKSCGGPAQPDIANPMFGI